MFLKWCFRARQPTLRAVSIRYPQSAYPIPSLPYRWLRWACNRFLNSSGFSTLLKNLTKLCLRQTLCQRSNNTKRGLYVPNSHKKSPWGIRNWEIRKSSSLRTLEVEWAGDNDDGDWLRLSIKLIHSRASATHPQIACGLRDIHTQPMKSKPQSLYNLPR